MKTLTYTVLFCFAVVLGAMPIGASATIGHATPSVNRLDTEGAEDFFPVGSKWNGTIERAVRKSGVHEISARVQRVDGNQVVVKVNEGLNAWVSELVVDGTHVTVTEIRAGRNRFSNIKMSGTVANGKLVLSGTWVREGHRTGNGEQATIELSRKAAVDNASR